MTKLLKYIAVFLFVFVFIQIADNRASALPVCYTADNALINSSPTNRFPRDGMGRISSTGRCDSIPSSTGMTGAQGTISNGSHILLSSYYYSTDPIPGSPLHTPKASLRVYTTQPNISSVVRVNVGWCRGGDPGIVIRYKGTSYVGTGTGNVTFDAADFNRVSPQSPLYVSTMSLTTAIDNNTDRICKVWFTSSTEGTVISYQEDAEPTVEYPSTGNYTNRYNQTNWRTSKDIIGPSSPSSPSAFAVRGDYNATVEYAVAFSPSCSYSGGDIFLRTYDPDAPSGLNPEGTTNDAWLAGDGHPRTVLFEYNEANQFVRTINVTGDSDYRTYAGNDEYVGYRVSGIRKNFKYVWVWWNIGARNGVQVWSPYSDAFLVPGSGSCDDVFPFSCTITRNALTALPGQNVEVTVDINNNSPTEWTAGYGGGSNTTGESNYSIGVVDRATAYGVLNGAAATQNTDPGRSTGPPDYNNESYVAGSGINTVMRNYPGYAIDRFDMTATVPAYSSRTFSFYITAPANGVTRNLAVRLLNRHSPGDPNAVWVNYVDTCKFDVTGSDSGTSTGGGVTPSAVYEFVCEGHPTTLNARIRLEISSKSSDPAGYAVTHQMGIAVNAPNNGQSVPFGNALVNSISTEVPWGSSATGTLTVTSEGSSETYISTVTCPVRPQISCYFQPGDAEVGRAYTPRVRVVSANNGAPSVNVTLRVSSGSATPNSVQGTQVVPPGETLYVLDGMVFNAPGEYRLLGRTEFVFEGDTYADVCNKNDANGDGIDDDGESDFTVPVNTKPYFKVIGGDILVGNTEVNYGIIGNFMSGVGSSAQGATMQAIGNIRGVKSGGFMGGPENVLSFSNDPFASPSTGTYGGNFGMPVGWTWKLPNIQVDAQEFVGEPVQSGIWKIVNNTLPELNISPGVRSTLQYDGDLYINGDIKYSNDDYYNTVRVIPRLRIIATGTIYIRPNVTRIDGELLAGKAIYSCYTPGPFAFDNAACSSSTLVVNGSLTAPSIFLTRLKGSLNGATVNDGVPDGSGYINSGNIAEIINFNPEVYLQQEWGDGNTTLFNTYDSITALPPVF